MSLRILRAAAVLLLALLAGDLAFGAGCDPLAAPSSPTVASQSESSDERCDASSCASDCYCCSAAASGTGAPTILAPGPLALAVAAAPPLTREGAPPLPYHPPLS
jgi:hypothetical protein